jgi:cell division protein FtsI/penicillin-binding protein 2
MSPLQNQLSLAVAAACLLALTRASAQQPPTEAPPIAGADAPDGPARPAPVRALPVLGPRHLDTASGRFLASYGDGEAVLTLDARLQKRLERTLSDYDVPYGATVLLDPRTGRVLAMAEHSRAEPRASNLSLRALSPAASIFKIVTAAALLEQGYSPEEPVCFHGGNHRLAVRLLADDSRRDSACLPLATAFVQSANVVFAKLADRGLTPEVLRATADRFLFNASIPFPSPVETSRAEIPEDRFGLANTAAGFGDVRLSALHAAMLGAVVANRGVLVPPWLVELVQGTEPAPPLAEPMRIIDERVAEAIGAMMRETVTRGTAQRAFARPPRELRGVHVAGKTGSLNEQRPFRDHSWFVGYAPAEDPQVVVASVVVNGPLWRIRAPWVAREALAAYFADHLAELQVVEAPRRLVSR